MARFLFLLFVIPSLAAQTVKEVGITSEPSHHPLDFVLGVFRAFNVEVAPHGETLLHRHRRDYVSVTLADAHILDRVQGKPAVDVKLKMGDTRFVSGGFAHVVKNLSDQPFRNITIELLGDGHARHTQLRKEKEDSQGQQAGARVKTLFVKDGVRVSEINLEPGATVPNHRYEGLHLVVALTDLDLRSDIEGMDPMPLKFEFGEIKELPGGYTNTGNRAARFITLGF